jgi:hypothetical protein
MLAKPGPVPIFDTCQNRCQQTDLNSQNPNSCWSSHVLHTKCCCKHTMRTLGVPRNCVSCSAVILLLCSSRDRQGKACDMLILADYACTVLPTQRQ